ncbi:unnamed protein product [Porites lobata]|uniref:Uncharacterized protein n=1 Tax=Porites lobata TaxID=104759 RepID=A0ABN8PV03_9CNID|nr:unnamed protein product [Porites lobata]
MEGVLVDSGSTSNVIDGAKRETLREKKVKCDSRKSNRRLYSCGSNKPLTTAEETLLRDFPECFKGVGKLKGFQAKLYVDKSVKPVAQKLRPHLIG